MELTIVVARRSWLEISMWKTGEDRKKEKEHTRKKRDGIRTAELNRRDQVTAIVPGPVPSKGGTEVDNQVEQHLLNWERPPCTERQSLNQECGWKDGDRGGPARTEGIHRKEKRKKRKTHLTHTGLLMEGTTQIKRHHIPSRICRSYCLPQKRVPRMIPRIGLRTEFLALILIPLAAAPSWSQEAAAI